jgi:hypothetical protein
MVLMDNDPKHGSQGVTEPPQVPTCVQVRAENNRDGWETGEYQWESKDRRDKDVKGIMMRVVG